jgi:hypothetical protein
MVHKYNEIDLLSNYYMNQAGGGGQTYTGPLYQRGYGIGSFLGGLFRGVLPLLKRGGLAIGKEIFNSGTNILNDISENIPANVALKSRSKQAYANLKRKAVSKMNGSGAKKSHIHFSTIGQSINNNNSQQTNKKKGRKIKKNKIKKSKQPKKKQKKTKSKRKNKTKKIDIFS